jgi:predicted transcriptional regulator
VLMPYVAFLDGARTHRYDIELLQNRFGVGFEQVCHRLTTLRRPGASGVPFHMLRVDLAGNISKRISASGIRFARFSGACPRWNVFTAFMSPGVIRVQLSVMPDGGVYFCLARTVPKGRGGYLAPHTLHAIGLGCQLEHAPSLVYSDGVDLERLDGAVPVGVTCRLCERSDCEQRAFPSIRAPMAVDENVRGPSVYAPRTEGGAVPAVASPGRQRPGKSARGRP